MIPSPRNLSPVIKDVQEVEKKRDNFYWKSCISFNVKKREKKKEREIPSWELKEKTNENHIKLNDSDMSFGFTIGSYN
jgi:hypothetical protein